MYYNYTNNRFKAVPETHAEEPSHSQPQGLLSDKLPYINMHETAKRSSTQVVK
jgi:hypothetical protein